MRKSAHYLAAACTGLLLLSCAGEDRRQVASAQPLVAMVGDADADADYARGRSHYAAGRIGAALLAYRQALSVEPGHVNARNGLAVLYAGQGDYPRAIALWQGLTTGEVAAPAAQASFLFGNLGYAYFLAGDNEQAVAALEKACVLDPAHAQSWQRLGDVLEKMGQGARAALMFHQAETLRHHDAGADYALARSAAVAPITRMSDASALVPAMVPAMTPARLLPIVLPMVLPKAPMAPASVAGRFLRIEIRNGNGVPGMATALARTVDSARLRVVRVGNEGRFMVEHSRIEYPAGLEAQAKTLALRLGSLTVMEGRNCKTVDLRLILGHDLNDLAALRRYYLKQLKLAKMALAAL